MSVIKYSTEARPKRQQEFHFEKFFDCSGDEDWSGVTLDLSRERIKKLADPHNINNLSGFLDELGCPALREKVKGWIMEEGGKIWEEDQEDAYLEKLASIQHFSPLMKNGAVVSQFREEYKRCTDASLAIDEMVRATQELLERMNAELLQIARKAYTVTKIQRAACRSERTKKAHSNARAYRSPRRASSVAASDSSGDSSGDPDQPEPPHRRSIVPHSFRFLTLTKHKKNSSSPLWPRHGCCRMGRGWAA